MESQSIKLFYELIALSKQNDEAIFNHILSVLKDITEYSNDVVVKVNKDTYRIDYLEYNDKEQIREEKVITINSWLNKLFEAFYNKYTVESSSVFKQLEGKALRNSSEEKKNTIYNGLSTVKRSSLKVEWCNKFDIYFDFISEKYLFNKDKANSFSLNANQIKGLGEFFEKTKAKYIHEKTLKEDFITFFNGGIINGKITFKGPKNHLYYILKQLKIKLNLSENYLQEIEKTKKVFHVAKDKTLLIGSSIAKNNKYPEDLVQNNINEALTFLDY